MSFIGTLAAIPAIRKGQMKNIEKKLLKMGAVSSETAVMPEEAGICSRREVSWLDYLVKKGKVGKTADGKVWWMG